MFIIPTLNAVVLVPFGAVNVCHIAGPKPTILWFVGVAVAAAVAVAGGVVVVGAAVAVAGGAVAVAAAVAVAGTTVGLAAGCTAVTGVAVAGTGAVAGAVVGAGAFAAGAAVGAAVDSEQAAKRRAAPRTTEPARILRRVTRRSDKP